MFPVSRSISETDGLGISSTVGSFGKVCRLDLAASKRLRNKLPVRTGPSNGVMIESLPQDVPALVKVGRIVEGENSLCSRDIDIAAVSVGENP